MSCRTLQVFFLHLFSHRRCLVAVSMSTESVSDSDWPRIAGGREFVGHPTYGEFRRIINELVEHSPRKADDRPQSFNADFKTK